MADTVATVRFQPLVTRPDGTVVSNPPSPWPDHLAIATANDHVARALELMSRTESLGWVELYKVHEVAVYRQRIPKF